MAFHWPAYTCIGIWILPHILKKNVVKVGPPLTKLYGSAHAENQLFGLAGRASV